MRVRRETYRGCFLGMAVGDAMGYPVDSRSWQQIREDYGPNGLLGYDLMNGYAEITSHTQLAAFACDGMLIGITSGQMTGQMYPFVRYVGLGLREWAASQRAWGRPDRTFCWLLHQPEISRRHCLDTRMLETLSRDHRRFPLGSPDDPRNSYAGPGALLAAMAPGLCLDEQRMEQPEIDYLGAEIVALTHGSPQAYLTGAMLAHLTSLVIREPQGDFAAQVKKSAEAIKVTYGPRYSAAFEVCNLVNQALTMAQNHSVSPVSVMERLKCETCPQVLAGAVYAVLTSQGDFDRAMIIAVNHSGASAAVGAITGAMLGARLGETALPEFYMECLEPVEVLRELADDLYHGCPMERGNRLFDADWDRKYRHGGR